MKAILTYAPCRGTELLYYENCTEKLRYDSWLAKLIRDKYENKSIVFIGRDDKKRVEIEIDVQLFYQLKNDPLFIVNADKLRRLRTTSSGVLDYLVTGNVGLIDNDLDD